ncbi:hypothetical protein K1719_029822 [Acacia pycnantha]|nr:hypothetical protein K1719_029822 [Acacia pycnantha]
MDSGTNAVKDIAVDDVKYALDESVDSNTQEVKDIAVDDGEIKNNSMVVTTDIIMEMKDVNADMHEQLEDMDNKYDEFGNAAAKKLDSKAGQQKHDISRQKSDKVPPVTKTTFVKLKASGRYIYS